MAKYVFLAGSLFIILVFMGGGSLSAQNTSLSDKVNPPKIESLERKDIRDGFNLGVNFLFKKSYDLAIFYFLDTLKRDPSHFAARYFLGFTFYKLGKNREAIREWENLIRISGDNLALRRKISLLYRNQDLSDRKKKSDVYIWTDTYPKSKASGNNRLELNIPIDLNISDQGEVEALDFVKGDFIKLNSLGEVISSPFKHRQDTGFFNFFKNPWSFFKVNNSSKTSFKKTSNDEYWVSDFGTDRLVKVSFNSSKLLQSIGRKGTQPGEFLGPKGITSDEHGNFFVVDSGNSRVQYLTSNGKFIGVFGKRGREEGDFLSPDDVVYSSESKSIWVSDKGNRRITQYSVDGKLGRVVNSRQFQEPSKLLLQDSKHLLILDRGNIFRQGLADEKLNSIVLKGGVDKKFLFTSFAMDKNGYLYLGNSGKRAIDIYAPLEYSYANLSVMVQGIHLDKFPNVSLDVSVDGPDQEVLYKVSEGNVKVYENGLEFPFELSTQPKSRRIVLLIEHTDYTEEKKELVKVLIDELFDGLDAQDKVKIISFNANGYEEQTDFTRFRLYSIDRAMKGEFTHTYLVAGAFKKGIFDLNDTSFNNVMVMVMFSPLKINQRGVALNQIVNLGVNNNIPVYHIYMNPKTTGDFTADANSLEEFNSSAKLLSRKTGGGYLHYDEKAIFSFYEKFNRYQSGLLKINYRSISNPRFRSLLRNIKVVVNYKKLIGEDFSFYPIP